MSLMLKHEIEVRDALRRFTGSVPNELEVVKLKGHASTRSYYRLRVGHCSQSIPKKGVPGSLIAMRLPQKGFVSDEAIAGQTPEELPFLNVQRLLRKRGIPVPEVYFEDLEHGIVFLQDLGDETFEMRLAKQERESWENLYKNALSLLIRLHRRCERSDDDCIAYNRFFDRDLLFWELEHFREWGLEALFGRLGVSERELLDRLFSRLVDLISDMPKGFVHRDFQSRNLMWFSRHTGEDLVVIDFQDALIGPRLYDVAALLCDSYVDLDIRLQKAMLNRYLSEIEPLPEDVKELCRAFWLVALHRKLKDAGRFVFIDRERENPDFLAYYPQSLRYVGRALAELDGFDGLDSLLRRLIPGFPDDVIKPNRATRE